MDHCQSLVSSLVHILQIPNHFFCEVLSTFYKVKREALCKSQQKFTKVDKKYISRKLCLLINKICEHGEIWECSNGTKLVFLPFFEVPHCNLVDKLSHNSKNM